MKLRDVLINLRSSGRGRRAAGAAPYPAGRVVLLFEFAAVLLIAAARGGVEEVQAASGCVRTVGDDGLVQLARRFVDRRSLAGAGLAARRAGRDLLFGIGIAGAMMAFIYGSGLALGWIRFEGYAWHVPATEWMPDILDWVLIFLMVGWYEELLNRGYWLVNLSEGLNRVLAALITSIAFALLHANNPSASYASTAGLFVSGLWFAYTAFASRGLWLPVGAHIGWNIFEGVVFGFPVSGLTTATLIRQTALGPELWTGGPFGPEAGLILLPALALGALAVWGYTRGRS